MTKLVEYAPSLAIAAVAIGLFGYAVALMLAAFFSGKDGTLGARLSTLVHNPPSSKSRHSVRGHIRLRHRRRLVKRLPSLVGCKWPACIQGIPSRIQRAFRTDPPLVNVLSGVRRCLKAAAYMMLTLKGMFLVSPSQNWRFKSSPA
jgi:hypothetical protein